MYIDVWKYYRKKTLNYRFVIEIMDNTLKIEVFYMRKTLKDWKRDWIEVNGETNELEVVIKNSKLDEFSSYVYEGSFAGIPKYLLNKKVVGCGQIVESSVPERKGAYSLTI